MGFRDFTIELFSDAGFSVFPDYSEGIITVPSSCVYATMHTHIITLGNICCDINGSRYGKLLHTIEVKAYSDCCGAATLDEALKKIAVHTLYDSYYGASYEVQPPCYDSKVGRIYRTIKLSVYELHAI